MLHRLAFGMVASLVGGVGMFGVADQATPNSFTVIGIVRMVSSPDGAETVITVDRDDYSQSADGLIDQAFRIQHAAGLRFDYSGIGAITLEPHRLTLAAAPDVGWVFTVAGHEANLTPSVSAYSWTGVQGISHHWGITIQRAHDQVEALLFARPCSGTDTDACSSCEAGGEGVQGCSLEGSGACSADCTDGYFACCNTGSCRCCLVRERGHDRSY